MGQTSMIEPARSHREDACAAYARRPAIRFGYLLLGPSIALATLVGSALPAWAGDTVEQCHGYARQAVEQAETNKRLGCGYTGNRWGNYYEGHFQFCRSAKPSSVDHEVKARVDALESCKLEPSGQCRWDGREPLCNGGCTGDWYYAGKTEACFMGHKRFCCKPTPQRASFCNAYADTAVFQVAEKNKRENCQTASDGRWSSDRTEHYAWCAQATKENFDFPKSEEKARNDFLLQCGAVRSSSQLSEPGKVLLPRSCNVNVVLRVNQCMEGDGTPSQYFSPLTLPGCGADEMEAIGTAKAAFNGMLEEEEGDEAGPGKCSYTKESSYRGACYCGMELRPSSASQPLSVEKPPASVPQMPIPDSVKDQLLPPPASVPQMPIPESVKDKLLPPPAVPQMPIPGPVKDKVARPTGATEDSPSPPPLRCTGGMTLNSVGRCACRPGTRWNGRWCVGSPAQLPPTQAGGGNSPSTSPASQQVGNCPRGLYWQNGRCACPPGREFIRGYCRDITPKPLACPPGTRLLRPYGRCVPVSTMPAPKPTPTPQPTAERKCPAGFVGRWPRCHHPRPQQPAKCPPGSIGTWPRCGSVVR
jgi:hypothetical protein